MVAIRTGAEAGSGTAGSVGTALAGKYGTLVLNADGSWTYTIDTANQDVLNAAGAGRILSDVFTYTLRDTAGAFDQAQLTVMLDMVAPYQEPSTGPWFGDSSQSATPLTPLPDVDPVTFVHQTVVASQLLQRIATTRGDGTDIRQDAVPEIQSLTLGARLVGDRSEFVRRAVQEVRLASMFDHLQIQARQGIVSLSADGLLSDPSVFTPDPREMEIAPAKPGAVLKLGEASAPSFGEQLKLAAQRFKPVAVNFHANRVPVESNHLS